MKQLMYKSKLKQKTQMKSMCNNLPPNEEISLCILG